MPDLKSEMSKVINQWNNPVPTPTTMTTNSGRKITTNSTRITFDYVRDNPGVTRLAAAAALKKMGVNASSSTSLLSIMVARGNIRKEHGGLYVSQEEYAPLPKPTKNKKDLPPTLPPSPIEVAAPTAPTAPTADSVLANISVGEAFKLYQELRTMFGGNK
jgi:hypothetical protein